LGCRNLNLSLKKETYHEQDSHRHHAD
jgi:hypothetical protein